MDGTAEFPVAGDLNPASAKAVQIALLEAIGASENASFLLEIEEIKPAQVSLQILIADLVELRERGVPFKIGPTATSVLERSALGK